MKPWSALPRFLAITVLAALPALSPTGCSTRSGPPPSAGAKQGVEATLAALQQAIHERRLVQFSYRGGRRLVEPHMVAHNEAGSIVLSGWFVSGSSLTGEGPGWRAYLPAEMSHVVVLDQRFAGPRPGYRPDGGLKLHGIIYRL